MKKRGFSRLKRVGLALLLAACLCAGLISGFPALPVSQPTDLYVEQAEQILPYLRGSLPAMLYAAFAAVVSVLVFYGGALFRRRIKGHANLGEACELLGLFILLSGVWMLTDSRALCFFQSPQDAYGVVFVSFVCFMLMPVAFLACIGRLFADRLLNVARLLMTANLGMFLMMVLLRLDESVYLVSLAFHHAVMVFFIVYLIVLGLRKALSRSKSSGKPSAQESVHGSRVLMGGVLAFLALMLAAFVLFWIGGRGMYAVVLALGMAILIGTIALVVLDRVLNVRESQIQAEVYERLAFTDALSGIENRNAYLRDLQVYGDEAQLGCAVLDVNGLKQINDRYGHTAGDVVIQAAARAVRGGFASVGTCYRIGGDEFAVLAPCADERTMERGAASMRACVARENAGGCPELSIACGWAVRSSPGESAEQIFARADAVMYANKRKMKEESGAVERES